MRRAIFLGGLLCIALLAGIGCAEVDAPVRFNELPQRLGRNPLTSRWDAILIGGALIIMLPTILWRRRLAYASAVCMLLAGLCIVAWAEGRQAGGHYALIQYTPDASGAMDFSFTAIQWGNGGLSLQHRVTRATDEIGVASDRKEPPLTFLWLRANQRHYPFGSRESWRSPRSFPLTLGFEFYFSHEGHGFADPKTAPLAFSVTAPIWFLLVLLSVVPLLWIRRTWRKWRGRRLGLCRECGYDLRASGDRCPECGAATTRAARPVDEADAPSAAGPEPAARTKGKFTRIEALGAVAYVAALISLAALLRYAPPAPPPQPVAQAPPGPTSAATRYELVSQVLSETVLLRDVSGRLVSEPLEAGTTVTVLKRERAFTTVRTADGRVGRVPTSFLLRSTQRAVLNSSDPPRPERPAPPRRERPVTPATRPSATAPSETAAPPADPAPGVHKLKETSLFKRDDAGRLLDDTLDAGTTVTVLKTAGLWSTVRTADGRVGLVPSTFLGPPVR